ncbi:hypothetical protein J2Z37_004089 [Ammoniphilus resinae]|uniref:Uncharacterized protein n=1 Tax=Ammoniphilus resinae TaxID=861532 RepID=A0ABS4GVM2_9BACL|nr:hypothetical protein [Ammoniphilus resinae]
MVAFFYSSNSHNKTYYHFRKYSKIKQETTENYKEWEC